jgi:hypothetical protein
VPLCADGEFPKSLELGDVISHLRYSDDHPAVWQHILSEFAIEHQLIAAGLRHLRRCGQLIEKQNAFSSGGKELGRHPFGLIRCNSRQPPQIDRIELHGAYVEELIVEIVGDLRDDLRRPTPCGAFEQERLLQLGGQKDNPGHRRVDEVPRRLESAHQVVE